MGFIINSGVFGYEHIIYLVVLLALIVVGSILLKKKVKDENLGVKIVKISALVLLVLILTNRISVTYYDVVINKRESYSWLNLIPNSYCGLASLVFSMTVLFGKKDHFILHCISYLGVIGGVLTMFYPDFLDSQKFLDIRSITGLLHHTVMVWLFCCCIITGYIKPAISKWKYFLLGCCVIITFGVFEMDCLGFTKAMQIGEPLISDMPVLTSWYVVGVLVVLIQLGFLVIYEVKVNKKALKEIVCLNNNNKKKNIE